MNDKKEIKFTFTQDNDKLFEKIEWEATDSGMNGTKECNAMLLSIWDKNEKVTLGIDIWTKEMLVDDMNIHFLQTFEKMADTYARATQNEEAADLIRSFSKEFGKKVKLVE